MITIQNTAFESSMHLCDLLDLMTKDKIVAMITKLDEYISPNLKKAETVKRAAEMILRCPRMVLDDLNKNELQLVKSFIDAGANAYIECKMHKADYKLQKYGLVLTYEDDANQIWKLLMPDEVREAFARDIDESIKDKELHPKKLSRKERMIEDYLK